MKQSTKTRPDTSLILALVAALIVAAHDASWLARPVKDLIPPGSGIRPDTLSKLKARVLGAFLAAIVSATRVGRKPILPAPQVSSAIDDECARIKQVIEKKRFSGPKRQAQEYLVEAFERLTASTPISQKLFCQKVGVSERSFRYWCKRKLKPLEPSSPPEPRPAPRPRGEGRFDLDRTIPGIQQMADTTEIEIAGNKLKIIAVQDPGNRHRDLWTCYHVDATETADMVSDLVGQAPDGTQTIHDRGTPYVADKTRATLDDKGCEVAPCKEYTPTEKATLERSNRTVKEAISPMVAFFDSLAAIATELKCPAIGVCFVQLALDLFHHAFRLGHRDLPHPLEGHDPELLDCIAQAQLEKARDGQRSKLSLLARIHDAYAMAVGLRSFIRAHSNHALEDIVEAERRLADAVLNGIPIREIHRYFAAILSNVATPRREQRRRERERREKRTREHEQQRKHDAWLAHLASQPVVMLRQGLDVLAHQWRDDHFLFGDVLFGLHFIEEAVSRMASSSPESYHEDLIIDVKRWYLEHGDHSPPVNVMVEIVERVIAERRHPSSEAG
jgi:hypothetical protein